MLTPGSICIQFIGSDCPIQEGVVSGALSPPRFSCFFSRLTFFCFVQHARPAVAGPAGPPEGPRRAGGWGGAPPDFKIFFIHYSNSLSGHYDCLYGGYGFATGIEIGAKMEMWRDF